VGAWLSRAAAANVHTTALMHAIAQGVPGWIGNGSYFSDDNIQYQAAFVAGARAHHNISIDYIGIWNERPWGSASYVKQLRAALDAVGAQSTVIVGSDAVRNLPDDLLTALGDDADFSSVVDVVGVHYPCNRTAPPQLWSLKVRASFPQHLLRKSHITLHHARRLTHPQPSKTLWSNEDFSTVADWAGASCWGRTLNQNWVLLNATSTIAWSTIWSVYPSWPYFGNGLMCVLFLSLPQCFFVTSCACTPSRPGAATTRVRAQRRHSLPPLLLPSSSAAVNPTVWTTAHTTQVPSPPPSPPA